MNYATFLQQRNYPKSLVEHGINKATYHDRNDLLQIKDKTEKYVIPYVSTHNPKNQEFFQIIKSNLPLLERDQKMNEVLNKFQIIKSKRQSPSLKKILTRAKFENIEETPAVRKCQIQDVQHVLTYKKANSSNSKTAEISTYILLLHVKVRI